MNEYLVSVHSYWEIFERNITAVRSWWRPFTGYKALKQVIFTQGNLVLLKCGGQCLVSFLQEEMKKLLNGEVILHEQ